jgi:hypothetical protein
MYAGCGCRSFFNADGVELQPCPGCGHAFYCSDACREFDYPSHKAECRCGLRIMLLDALRSSSTCCCTWLCGSTCQLLMTAAETQNSMLHFEPYGRAVISHGVQAAIAAAPACMWPAQDNRLHL